MIEDLHLADAATRAVVTFLARVARDQRLVVVGTTQSDVVARYDPWSADLDAIVTGPQPPRRLVIPPLDRDELAALIEGIEGERASASLLLLVAERSGGLAARRRGAARRPAGAPQRIADRVVRRPRHRPAGDPVAGVPARPAAHLAGRAAADGGPAGGRGRRLRGRHQPTRAALGQRPANRCRRARCRPVGRPGRGARQRLHRRSRRRDRVPPPIDRQGVARDLLPVARTSHHAALAGGLDGTPAAVAWHWLSAYDPLRARSAAIEAAAFAGSRHAAADELSALELALALVASSGGSGPARRRVAPALDRVDLQVRASEAAFAVGQTSRASAFLEAAIGGLDARRDRIRLGLLHERLAQIRRAAGDPAGAMHAARRAVELVPRDASPERATVLAGLAQLKMLDGIFSESQRLAREAIKVARACVPVARAQEIHATTTLAVASAWGSDPTGSIDLLREAERAAVEMDDPDALFRIRANLTTVLDLQSRRSEAVEVAYEAIEDARRSGLEAVYGNFLGANVADTLFLIGRWPEARALSERAMSWLPVGVAYLAAVLQLAIVEIETDAGEAASRLLGQTILEFDAVREPQLAAPYYLAAASFALWRGDNADASRSVDRGWASVQATEEWLLVARMAAMVAQVDAATATEAREHRQLAPLAAARERTAEVLAKAADLVRASGTPMTAGSRRVAEASLATARAYQRRLEGDDDPSVWRRVALGWVALDAPYDAALARWRQAEAMLATGVGRSGRARAQAPLLEAAELGLRLGAKPLLRELRELAGRARIALPAEVDDYLDEAATDGTRAVEPADAAADRTNGHSDLVRTSPVSRRPRRAPTPSGSAVASGRCSRSWRRAAPTGRSGNGCSSARRRSASTSATSCPSWRSRAVLRRRPSRSGSD